jgi:hypothetical protein
MQKTFLFFLITTVNVFGFLLKASNETKYLDELIKNERVLKLARLYLNFLDDQEKMIAKALNEMENSNPDPAMLSWIQALRKNERLFIKKPFRNFSLGEWVDLPSMLNVSRQIFENFRCGIERLDFHQLRILSCQILLNGCSPELSLSWSEELKILDILIELQASDALETSTKFLKNIQPKDLCEILTKIRTILNQSEETLLATFHWNGKSFVNTLLIWEFLGHMSPKLTSLHNIDHLTPSELQNLQNLRCRFENFQK